MAELAARNGTCVLISDEIYRAFCYDRPFVSPASTIPRRSWFTASARPTPIPGWRLGFAHGPAAIIHEMIKLEQYSFVCPHSASPMGRGRGVGS